MRNSIFVVTVFSIIAGLALLRPGLPPTHDGEYHIIRFYEFNKALRDGDWYPRWAPDLNNGFGVPLFNYVYPLPNYIASLLHFLGISFIDAFKLQMFIATLVGGIFFYLWARQFWGNLGGIVSSVFYTFSPYHFVDIYIRGSVGEVWALALFPAFLWSLTKSPILAGIFLAGIIFSHNILALMFFPFALSYAGFLIFQGKNKKHLIRNITYAILLGLTLSAIFWLPAILERQYVTGLEIYDIRGNFPELYQLLIPSWGSGFSGADLQNQMSFQIGVGNLLVVLFGLLAAIVGIKKRKRWVGIVLFSLVWFIAIFLLLLKVSLPIWERVPFMNYFQFPWRFLSLEILITSFLAGSVLKSFDFAQGKIFLAFFLTLLVFLLGIGYAKPAYYHQRNDAYYTSRPNFIDGTNSPGNYFNTIWINRDLKRANRKLTFVKGEGEILSEITETTNYTFDVLVKQDSETLVNTAYFPGWIVLIDGKKILPHPNKDGLISFEVPKGKHLIRLRFVDTPVREIGKISFFLSLIILSFLLIDKHFARIRR